MKKEAREAIAKKLKDEQTSVRRKLEANRYQMSALVKEQTKLKRMLPELHALIRSLA